MESAGIGASASAEGATARRRSKRGCASPIIDRWQKMGSRLGHSGLEVLTSSRAIPPTRLYQSFLSSVCHTPNIVSCSHQ